MSCFDSLESMKKVITSLPLDRQKELDKQWKRYKSMTLQSIKNNQDVLICNGKLERGMPI